MSVEMIGIWRQSRNCGSGSLSDRQRAMEMISIGLGRFMLCALLIFSTWLYLVQVAAAVEDSRTGNAIALFSQGRSAVDPQNREGSRQEAIRDFLGQAVVQAAARILTPSDLETRYSSLSETIFNHPERFVLSYQISSEGIEEGNVYRIAGQVSIDVDLLKNDLLRRGPDTPESPSTVTIGVPVEPPVAEPADKGQAGGYPEKNSAGWKKVFKRVLWAVAEEWGEKWHLPRSSGDPEATFSAFVSQEVEDFGWSLVFPPSDFAQPYDDGSLNQQEVLAAARARGATYAVLGTLVFGEGPDGGERLTADLAVFHVALAKEVGNLKQELSVDAETAEEKAMELAALTVPQVDRMLGQVDSGAEDRRGGESGDEALKDLPRGEGLILRVRSRQPQADWEEIEGVIRRKAGSIQILGLRFGKDGGIVQLQGVDKGALLSLNGLDLQGNATLRVEAPSPDGNILNLTIVQSEMHGTNQ